MTYCVKCGAKVEDGIGMCPQCGAVIPGAFDTPDPQKNNEGQNIYSEYTQSRQETYGSQAYEEQSTYNGQAYGQQDTYNGQAYGQQDTYNGQAYGQQSTYNGQAYGQQDAYNGQTYGQQNTYNQGYAYEQSAVYDYDPEYFPQDEVKRNKVMGVLSYIGILVLIPAIAGDKSSDYLKQHLNQGLVLFVFESILEVIEKIVDDVMFVGGIVSWGIDIVDFALLILAIMGIVSAAKGTRKLLPTIGNIKIFR